VICWDNEPGKPERFFARPKMVSLLEGAALQYLIDDDVSDLDDYFGVTSRS